MSNGEQQTRALIAKCEGLGVEFKTCRNRLNRDVYETVCAFLNRHGGTLLLGVRDNGSITGIDPDAFTQIRKDFVTAINNPQKLSPPTYLSINDVDLDGHKLLRIYVPESSQVHRCNGRIYDRNEDGDLDITDQTTQVARLYQRKQATYSENKIYPHLQPNDLRSDLIERCRRHVRINRNNHPWTEMDDAQLLQSAQLAQTDPTTGDSGVTLAGIMLFGHDEQILQACPAHRTDLILRKVNTDRYDDRDLVRTNLIDSYDRILAFVQKHLPDPFYLQGTDRLSLRDTIFREVASNILIHREYVSGEVSRLVIEWGRVTTENPNRPHGFGVLDTETAIPFPKNPVIGAFFREIDRADELGSGMRKLRLYGKSYGGAHPEFIEGDTFRIVIAIPEFGERSPAAVSGDITDPVTDQLTDQVTDQVAMLVSLLAGGAFNTSQMMQQLSMSHRPTFRKNYLHPALDAGYIAMTQPDSPNSPTQQYRLTPQGKALLKALASNKDADHEQ